MVDSSWGMVAGLDHAAQTASAISWSDLPCGQPGRSARSHLRKRFRSARFSQDAGGGLPEDGVADAWVKQVCDCVHPGSSKSASARIHKWAGPEILNNHSPARLRSQGSCNFFPRLSITPSPAAPGAPSGLWRHPRRADGPGLSFRCGWPEVLSSRAAGVCWLPARRAAPSGCIPPTPHP